MKKLWIKLGYILTNYAKQRNNSHLYYAARNSFRSGEGLISFIRYWRDEYHHWAYMIEVDELDEDDLLLEQAIQSSEGFVPLEKLFEGDDHEIRSKR